MKRTQALSEPEAVARPARVVLREWLEANPKASAAWRQAADRLASGDPDVLSAWRRLGDANVMQVFTAACLAAQNASLEARRQPKSEERAQLQRVKQQALDLKEAIERSPLPNRSAPWIELTGDESPSILMLAWRTAPAGPGFGYSMTLPDLLDQVAELVDQHAASLPPRAVKRARENTERNAFVVWLTWLLPRRNLPASPAIVAKLSNAVLALKEPLDADAVKAILHHQPAEFRVPKARRPTR